MSSLKLIWKHKRTFLPLILGVVIINIFLVGLMSEETYVTIQDTMEESSEAFATGQVGIVARGGLLLASTIMTGGLNSSISDTQIVFIVLIFLIVWLTSIYLARQVRAGNKLKLREGLYNSMSPFISTLVVAIATLIFLVPVFILIITYSAAVTTGFLATPFYAFLFFIFAGLLLLLSAYLLPGALMGLVAVTTPGLYPLAALNLSFDLVISRRIRLFIRIIFFLASLLVLWILIMFPIILVDLWFKDGLGILTGIPIVPFFLAMMTAFSFIYFAVYFYLLYRRLLDDTN